MNEIEEVIILLKRNNEKLQALSIIIQYNILNCLEQLLLCITYVVNYACHRLYSSLQIVFFTL
jgi:hypothetical protein